jgi:serine/threonine-protein kinase
MNFLDSLSSGELLISDFLAPKKKQTLIYIALAVILYLLFYKVKSAEIKNILAKKKESTFQTFSRSEIWRNKAEVPFLKTERFREDALGKFLPLLESYVQEHDLMYAYIVDPKSDKILAHCDTKFIDTEYQYPGKAKTVLMKNNKIAIGKHAQGEVMKTDVTMIILPRDGNLILRTYAGIPYGKARREIGIFVTESSFDNTQIMMDAQKKYNPLVIILLILALPGILAIEYFQRVRTIREELSDYDERYIGPYKNIKLIGEGSMGKVYQATRSLKGKGIGRKVALKVINEVLSNKREFLNRFNNEAQMVARLGLHRNIVGLYDFGQVKINNIESFGLEMPFVNGITLDKIIEHYNKDITVAQALYICLEILNGLSHAHNLRDESNNEITPIVHRDISPKNIILSFNGSVLITDFGIAKSNELAGMTIPGELMGTFVNMAPEQANCENVDCRADIFSVGTIMYEMVLKKKLYDAEEIRVLWYLVSKAEIPEISGIDEQLKKIILKSLARDPSQRYHTDLEMMRDIKDLINKNYKEYDYDEKNMETFLASKQINKLK